MKQSGYGLTIRKEALRASFFLVSPGVFILQRAGGVVGRLNYLFLKGEVILAKKSRRDFT